MTGSVPLPAVPRVGDVVLPTEKEYRLSRLAENVDSLAGKRLALYGSGVNAREVLERFGDRLDIACVVDDGRAPGELCGVPIVHWEEALALHPDAVLIAAKTTSAYAIWQRVGESCRAAGVRLLDMYGNDAHAVFGGGRTDARVPLRNLLSQVERHDVVSLDAALAERPRDARFRDSLDDPSLVSFFSWLARIAQAMGKRVVVWADGDAVPIDVPGSCGVFRAANCGCVRENGYFRLLRALWPGERIMHVGCDFLKDVACARVQGVDGFHVAPEKPPVAYLEHRDASQAQGEAEQAVAALLNEQGEQVLGAGVRIRRRGNGNPGASSGFENEHVPGASVQIRREGTSEPGVSGESEQMLRAHVHFPGTRSFWDLGYRALGPVVLGFILWLRRAVPAAGVSRVLFAARDSWLPYRAWEMLRESCPGLPPGHYLLMSRMSCALPLAHDMRMAEYLAITGGGMLPSAMLAQRFGLDAHDTHVPAERDVDDPSARMAAAIGHADAIAAKARASRAGQAAYWRDVGLEPGGRYALVQAIAAGTEQMLMEETAPFELRGLYLARRPDAAMVGPGAAESYVSPECAFAEDDMMHLEALMASPDPSLREYAPDGTPVFAAQDRDARQLHQLRVVQEGALAFVRAALAKGDAVVCGNIRPEFAAGLLFCNDDATVDLRGSSSWMGESRPAGLSPSGMRGEAHAAPHPAEPAARSVHGVLLGLLAAFDAVCREFGLTYIATHGTLLGAVRHGGFVPWDDDLDVAMPRADYDRLLQLAEAGVFPPPFFLQTPENDPGCFYGGYAKLRDSSTSAIEPGNEKRDFNQGMWMDILPLDACPADDAAVRRNQRAVIQVQRALYAQTYGLNTPGLWGAKPEKVSAYFLAGRALSRVRLCALLRRLCMAFRDTGVLTVFAGNYQWRRNDVRYAVSDVEDCRRVPFEEADIPIPAHAEDWLAAHYGPSWREQPVDAPASPRHAAAFDPDVPYRCKLVLTPAEGSAR